MSSLLQKTKAEVCGLLEVLHRQVNALFGFGGFHTSTPLLSLILRSEAMPGGWGCKGHGGPWLLEDMLLK
jgi:hypothetical protein